MQYTKRKTAYVFVSMLLIATGFIGYHTLKQVPGTLHTASAITAATNLIKRYGDLRTISILTCTDALRVQQEQQAATTELRTALATIRGDITANESTIATHDAEARSLTASITSWRGNVTTNTTQYTTIKAQHTATARQITSKQKSCAKLRGDAKTACTQDVIALRATLQGHADQMLALQNQNKQHNLDISTATKRIAWITKEKARLAKVVAALNKQLTQPQALLAQLDTLRLNLNRFIASNQCIQQNRIPGCTDMTATNFNPQATVSDGSCTYADHVCTDPRAINGTVLQEGQIEDNTVCDYGNPGCTERSAKNYNPAATVNDGSCIPGDKVCKDPAATNYDPIADESLRDNTLCNYDLMCPCEAINQSEAEQVSVVKVNITAFGGPNDKVVTSNEKGSISGERLRSMDPNDLYTAWPMPDAQDNLGVPNIESCFGPETESWKGEKISDANEAMKNYTVEISHTGPDGVKRTVRARPIDRGPANGGRWDASRGVWKALGLESTLDGNPNSAADQVELEIRLVPNGAMCVPVN